MKKFNCIDIPIGEIGVFKVNLPIVQIGNGQSPHLCILCGVHGDETASLVISHLFLKRISGEEIFGKISVITGTNPFAQATNSRVSLTDFYDLNRTGLGKSDGVFTERLAYKIVEFLASNCSHIIDLHEFEMDTPPMAIYIPSQDDTVDRQTLQMIRAFNPATVWSMDLSDPNEVRYSGSLLAVLINKGVPGFAIETSRLCVAEQSEVERVVDGLFNVVKLLGIIKEKNRLANPIAYRRIVKHSDYAGIWLPEKAVMSQVSKGEKIGKIVGLDLFSEHEVVALADGILIQIRRAELVQTGTNLFTIGRIDSSTTEKLS